MTPSEMAAHALLEIGAVGFTPQHPITFKSGMLSPVYVDNRRLPFHPAAWRVVLEGFAALIAARGITYDAIAGMEAAGIPHSAALGYALQQPSLFVRKQRKEHGKGRMVEGGDIHGKRVLLVEDLVTTGGSSLGGVTALREEGATVTDCLAIVSYGFKESRESFERAEVTLHVLVPFEDLLRVALLRGDFDEATRQVIDDWHTDPYGWGVRHGFGGEE
jgi:orotate phosphoribosyltransferase